MTFLRDLIHIPERVHQGDLVLNLLLAGNTQARATPELATVVAKHGWTHGKKFLLVPYHMIGAKDMESAILGQYAEFVRKRHPEAPVAQPARAATGAIWRRVGTPPASAQLPWKRLMARSAHVWWAI